MLSSHVSTVRTITPERGRAQATPVTARRGEPLDGLSIESPTNGESWRADTDMLDDPKHPTLISTEVSGKVVKFLLDLNGQHKLLGDGRSTPWVIVLVDRQGFPNRMPFMVDSCTGKLTHHLLNERNRQVGLQFGATNGWTACRRYVDRHSHDQGHNGGCGCCNPQPSWYAHAGELRGD